MLDKDAIFKKFFADVANLRKNPPAHLVANLRRAGAFVDVGKLVESGWTLKNGLRRGHETLEDGNVVLLRKMPVEKTDKKADKKAGRKAGKKAKDEKQKDEATEIEAYLSKASKREPMMSGGHDCIQGDALVDAYIGNGPHFAYFRWAQFKRVNEKQMKMLLDEIDAATVEPAMPLIEDIDHLLWDVEYSGEKPLSEHDAEVAKLFVLVDKNLKQGFIQNVRRLFAPLARALLTADDPEGRAFISATEDPELLLFMAVDMAHADMNEAAKALLGLVLLDFWDAMEEEFSAEAWLQSGALAEWLCENVLAAYMFSRGVPMVKDKEKRSAAAFDASRNVLGFLQTYPDKGEELEFVTGCLDALMQDIDGVSEARVLQVLAHAWNANKGEKPPPEEVSEMAMDATVSKCASFDAGLDASDSYFKEIPMAVKAQLEWQTFLALYDGAVKDAITSFPTPVYTDFIREKLFPPFSFVRGLNMIETWQGIMPADPDEKVLGSLINGIVSRAGKRCASKWEALKLNECTSLHSATKARFRDPRVASKPQELEALVMEAPIETEPDKDKDKDKGKGAKARKTKAKPEIIAAFPFLPKERPENAANCSYRVWETFRWPDQVAADFRIELDSGRQIYAVAPFHLQDRKAILTGLKLSGLLAVFPFTLKASDSAVDSFEQNWSNSLMSRSGVRGLGQVIEVRGVGAGFSEYDLLRFTVKIDGVSDAIPVIINRDHIEGRMPVAGDRVYFAGWAYIDTFDSAESVKEYLKKHPNGLPSPFPPEETDKDDGDGDEKGKGASRHDGNGSSAGESGKAAAKKDDARTEKPAIFLVECRLAGTSHVDSIERKMASVTSEARLGLKREKANAWDSDAIAVLNPANERVGYVPQTDNAILSRLMDGGKTLFARLVSKKTENRYFKVTIGIYLED